MSAYADVHAICVRMFVLLACMCARQVRINVYRNDNVGQDNASDQVVHNEEKADPDHVSLAHEQRPLFE